MTEDPNDIAGSFDFTAAANEAIQATEPVEEAPVVAEEPVAEQARDDAGRFAAKDEAAEEAAEPEDTGDVAAQVAQLQKRLADKDEFIHRQGNELGDLRKAFEDRFDTLEQRQAQPTQAVTADLIDRDPATATRLAWQQGDQNALGAAYESWKMEDPAAAGAWAAYTAAEQQMQQMQAAHDKRLEELESRLTPVAQANVDRQREQEIHAFAAEVPAAELSAFLESPDFVALATELGLEESLVDPARQAKTLKTLFYVHRGRTADTLTRTVQEVARTTAEAAEQATTDAYVASASTATATTSENKTEGELIADRMAARFAARTTDAGWD